jgi:hypothetical protein
MYPRQPRTGAICQEPLLNDWLPFFSASSFLPTDMIGGFPHFLLSRPARYGTYQASMSSVLTQLSWHRSMPVRGQKCQLDGLPQFWSDTHPGQYTALRTNPNSKTALLTFIARPSRPAQEPDVTLLVCRFSFMMALFAFHGGTKQFGQQKRKSSLSGSIQVASSTLQVLLVS